MLYECGGSEFPGVVQHRASAPAILIEFDFESANRARVRVGGR